MISENIIKIQSALENTNTKLIAVSKTQSVEKMMEAYNVGVHDFGENHVQELLEKIDKMPKDTKWHMIGHLQTNKVKYIIGKVELIHSLDSIKLANEIDKEGKKKGIITNVLIEVNIANEPSKYGFHISELNNAINYIKTLENIKIQGFMCVAPKNETEEKIKLYFDEMCNLRKQYGYEILSMGMSNDYKIAIEENSSYIRVGTKIFGPRNY